MVQHRAMLTTADQQKVVYDLSYRTARFSMTLNDPYSAFKVTTFFDTEYIRNGTRYGHSFNGILIGT